MKSINDLKVEKTYFKREVDALGNVTRNPYKKMMKRPVETVDPGVRLGYFILDSILFYFLFLMGVFVFFFLIEVLGLIGLLKTVLSEEMMYIFFFMSYFLYYALSECFFGGTLGKLICGYRVINIQAERVSIGLVFLRTIIRYIPFEFLSCISGLSWHDKWSKTFVVKKKEKLELQKLLGTMHENAELLD